MDEFLITYDGAYPTLCFGNLVIEATRVCPDCLNDAENSVRGTVCLHCDTVHEKGAVWEIEEVCIRSGGLVVFTEDWEEVVTKGEWEIEWPPEFPERLRDAALKAFNEQVTHGCCGGCV